MLAPRAGGPGWGGGKLSLCRSSVCVRVAIFSSLHFLKAGVTWQAAVGEPAGLPPWFGCSKWRGSA